MFNTREEAVKDCYFTSIKGYLINKYNYLNSNNVYHYTDIGGFRGIFENKTLWISNNRFLNDRNEYYDGKKLCEKVITEFINEFAGAQKDFLLQLKESLNGKSSRGIFNFSNQVFSMSFCNNGDLLNMWRGYGKTGGISIGFDWSKIYDIALMNEDHYSEKIKSIAPDKMLPDFADDLMFIYNVVYDDEKKINIIKDIINMGLEHIDYKERLNDSRLSVITAVHGVSDTLFNIIPIMKNYAFSEEEECRYIYYFNSKNNKNIHFRERNGLLLPYLKFKMLDRNCRPLVSLPVVDIIIGPNSKQDDIAESIKYFLFNIGYEDLIDKVRLSEIPYRD